MRRSKAEFMVPILLELLFEKGIINESDAKKLNEQLEREYAEYLKSIKNEQNG